MSLEELFNIRDNNPHDDTGVISAWPETHHSERGAVGIGRWKREQKDTMRFHYEKDMIERVCTVCQSGQG